MRQRGGRFRSLLIVGAVCCWAAACDGTATPPNAGTRRIEGYVRDARDGSPLSAAAVTFRSDALDEASTETDEEGFYVLDVVTHHPFGVVRAERAGYQPAQADVYFDAPVRRIDLEMQPLPSEGE